MYGVAFYSVLLLFSLFNYRFLATLQVILVHSKWYPHSQICLFPNMYNVCVLCIDMLCIQYCIPPIRWSSQPAQLVFPATLPIFSILYFRFHQLFSLQCSPNIQMPRDNMIQDTFSMTNQNMTGFLCCLRLNLCSQCASFLHKVCARKLPTNDHAW